MSVQTDRVWISCEFCSSSQFVTMTNSSPSRVFLAGAAGAIGRRLVPLLLKANYCVVGTTRTEERAVLLRAAGVEPVIVDMFDADAVLRAVVASRPDVVIHQLTDLPRVFDSAHRAIVQSICFVYAPGPQPFVEKDAIDSPSVRAMEAAALGTAGVEGVVLRYGRLWGPGTWTDVPKGPAALHVDAAAHAALLAITRGAPGIYNIAEPDGTVSTTKAGRDLGFDPNFRLQE